MSKLATIIACACAIALSGASARAALVLDQANDLNKSGSTFVGLLNGDDVPGDRGQTFTVGVAGLLSVIELEIDRDGTSDLLVEIRGTSAGAPLADGGGAVLSSVLVPFASVPTTPGFFSVDIPDILVSVGQVLAITVQADGPQGSPQYTLGVNAGQYALGSPFTRNGDSTGAWSPGAAGVDIMFRTFVETSAAATIPEPATALLALSLLPVLAVRRSRRIG